MITDNFCLVTQTYEGRDKTVKFLQYLAKYLSWQYRLSPDNDAEDPFEKSVLMYQVSKQLYDARSLFRIFKSLFEIKRIKIILQ